MLLSNYGFSQTFNERGDTIKVQMLISTIDSSQNAYLQIPVFARNGYVVIKENKVVRYLDFYRQPLSQDEIVWDFRKMK